MKSEAKFSFEVRKDLKNVYGDNIHVELVPNMIRTGRKPYDFYLNFKDHFCGVECKKVDGHTFNFNQVESHQPDCLRAVNKSGGTGLFLITFNRYKTSFILTPDQLDNLVLNNSKSLHITVFQKSAWHFEMKRGKSNQGTRWYVEQLIRAATEL